MKTQVSEMKRSHLFQHDGSTSKKKLKTSVFSNTGAWNSWKHSFWDCSIITIAKHTSFHSFLGLAHHVGRGCFFSFRELCFHQFQGTILPNTLVSSVFWGRLICWEEVPSFTPRAVNYIIPCDPVCMLTNDIIPSWFHKNWALMHTHPKLISLKLMPYWWSFPTNSLQIQTVQTFTDANS